MLPPNENSSLKRNLSIIATVLILAATALVIQNRQFVSDSLIGMFYYPTDRLLEVEDRINLTGDAKRIFRATQPELSSPDAFNNQCPRQEPKSPIIGCYTSDDRIFIYNIQNHILDGMKEVTAAHEMLHAVWKRSSESEKENLSKLLNAAYQRLKTKELEERMAYYGRTQPDDADNELHSILGTEFADLGVELEDYYSKYFGSRQEILRLHAQYDNVYKDLRAQLESITGTMDTLSARITENKAVYERDAAALSVDIDRFNARASSGDFPSNAAFYSERSALVYRTNQLNIKRDLINADIEEHGKLREEYVKVASQLELLNKSLDSFESIESSPQL